MARPTLHMCPEDAWDHRDQDAPYAPAAYEAEGFIHCTDGDDEMVKTANRFYRDAPGSFLVLTVDLDLAGSPWRFDEPGRPYPHIYGRIDPAAVTEVRRLVREADGSFSGITSR